MGKIKLLHLQKHSSPTALAGSYENCQSWDLWTPVDIWTVFEL